MLGTSSGGGTPKDTCVPLFSHFHSQVRVIKEMPDTHPDRPRPLGRPPLPTIMPRIAPRPENFSRSGPVPLGLLEPVLEFAIVFAESSKVPLG
jgi:hypothetical protein